MVACRCWLIFSTEARLAPAAQPTASARPVALPCLTLNLLKQILRGKPSHGVLLCTERFEIYPVATCDVGWTANVIVVLRTVLVDRVVRVLGQIRSDQLSRDTPMSSIGADHLDRSPR